MALASATVHVVERAPKKGCHSVDGCSCPPPQWETLQDQQCMSPIQLSARWCGSQGNKLGQTETKL